MSTVSTCVAALSCEAVLRVLLAVRCCSCGYGIICPSYGLYGSISIYYKVGLRVSGCMCTYVYNLTLPLLKRMTDMAENVTFPQFRWRAVDTV